MKTTLASILLCMSGCTPVLAETVNLACTSSGYECDDMLAAPPAETQNVTIDWSTGVVNGAAEIIRNEPPKYLAAQQIWIDEKGHAAYNTYGINRLTGEVVIMTKRGDHFCEQTLRCTVAEPK
jgi:hypothetical protein